MAMVLRLTAGKLEALQVLIQSWLGSRACSKTHRSDHWVRLNSAFRLDLRYWNILALLNVASFRSLLPNTCHYHFYSDSCGALWAWCPCFWTRRWTGPPRLGAGFLFGCCFPPGASCFDPAYLPSNRYLKFCGESGICAFPVCEWSLCFFVGHLHRAILSSHTVKSYLSAVCHTQVSMGLGDSSVLLFSDGRMLTRVRLVSTLH